MEKSIIPYLSVGDRLDMASPDQVNKNLEALAALFPNCITETENGKAVDFDLLKQELSHQVIEGSKERYRLEWPGKREAIVTANLPTTKTLRPVRADSLNFDETENLYIEGDNLEVLKLLQESYFGKIKMIYIDPPYNTGNDFVYKDNFAQATEEFKEESGLVDEQNQRLVANPETSGRYHSDWLSMMYSRLKLARNLLTEEGMILLSIDDNEIHNLRKLCDEILGEENFIECFIWKKRYGGGAKEKFIVNLHEYILFYCKNRSILNTIEVANNPEFIAKYYTKKDQFFNERGPYRTQPLEAAKSMGERKNLVYEIPGPDGVSIWPKRQWLWSKERTYDALKRDGLEFNVDSVGKYTVNIKQYLRDEDGNEKTLKVTSIIEEIFTQHGTKEIESIFGRVDYFSYPKPSELIKVLLKFGLKEGGIILDFFSGSATTAHAVMQLNAEDGVNRKFIMVQLPEAMDEKSEAYNAGYKNICDIGKDRIRRVGKKIQEELAQKKSKELDFSGQEPKQLDTGFRVYRLDSSNMQDVYYRPQDYQQDQLDIFADNIKPDRTADDLLAQVMLDWGLPLFYKIEPLLVLDKKVFRVAQDSLLACFDKGIDEAFAKEIASYKPLRIVFRDQSFKDDTAKENVRQLLKQLSPDTEMRVI